VTDAARPASTVAELVRRATERLTTSGSTSPRLDAELLMGAALGVDRVGVLAHPEAVAGGAAASTFEGFVTRREAGEPVAYIRGFREFHGRAIATDARALIPRPETEQLVDEAIAAVVARLTTASRTPAPGPIRVVDVGTGTGAIAVALVAALRRRRMDEHVEVLAVDISPDALDLARENAVGHGVADRMTFRLADLLPPGGGPWDIVCANLPYVATGTIGSLAPELAYEPALALDGGMDGLDLVRRLLGLLPVALTGDGVALLEIGADQRDAVVDAVAMILPGWPVAVIADLAGLSRIARVERPADVPAPGTTESGAR
jgi:release factor glutamine methyltransferase